MPSRLLAGRRIFYDPHVFLPLSKAVARAHSKLYPEEPYNDPRTLAAIALALSGLMPFYWRDPASGRLIELTDLELSAAQFTKAALEVLAVSVPRFEAALESLQATSLDQARVSLTLRQSPRAARPQSPRL